METNYFKKINEAVFEAIFKRFDSQMDKKDVVSLYEDGHL